MSIKIDWEDFVDHAAEYLDGNGEWLLENSDGETFLVTVKKLRKEPIETSGFLHERMTLDFEEGT